MKKISKLRQEIGEKDWAERRRQQNKEKSERCNLRKGFHVTNWRRRTKRRLIEYKGGKCIICGYDKDCPSAYAFHHRDPSIKEFNISSKCFAYDTLVKEVDKCDLMCARCHLELHDEKFEADRKAGFDKWEERKNKLEEIIEKTCPCGVKFKSRGGRQIFCTNKCRGKSCRKTEWPSKEKLKEMMEQYSMCSIGRMFNVSDNAVRKWAKTYGLEV